MHYYINILNIIYLCIIILVMQLVNGTQFLKFTFLLILFTGAAAAAVFGTVIVPLTCM